MGYSFDPKRPYHRAEIDLVFTKVKLQMHNDAILKGGDGRALYIDCYTGKTLRGGDRYDYEHIRSSESVFMTYRYKLTNNEIAEVVNCTGNLAVTLRTINQSKGKMKMEDWMKNMNNIAKYNIDRLLTFKTLSAADIGIEQKVNEVLLKR